MGKIINCLLIGLCLLNPFVLEAQERDCRGFMSFFEAGEYKETIKVLLDCKKEKGLNEETKKKIDFYLNMSYGLLEDYANVDAVTFENLIRDDVIREDENILTAYIVISNFHTVNLNYDKSVELNEEILLLAKQYISIESAKYAILLNRLKVSHINAGNYSKAVALGHQALNIYEQIFGKNHPDYVSTLNDLVACYFYLGDYSQAINLAEQALAIGKGLLGEDHPDYATSLNNLSLIYSSLGDYSKAIEFGEQAAAIYKQFFGESHPYYATSLNNLANYYMFLGGYSKAIDIATQVLSIRKEVLGEEHPDYAMSLNNLGQFYSSLGDYSKAFELGQQASDIYKHFFGENHSNYATSLNNLAKYYFELGDYSKAIELGQQALNIRKQALGEDHPDYAMSLNNLANYYFSLGDYSKAVELGQQASDIYKQVFGENHPDYAMSLNNLGQFYSSLGDYSKAIEYSLQALSIQERVLGKNHPNYALSLSNLAGYYFDLKNFHNSAEYLQKAIHIKKEQLKFQFAWLTESERDLYWNQEKALFMLLPYFGYSSANSGLFANLIYDSALLSKGLILSTSMELDKLLLESGNEKAMEKTHQLRTTHHTLNRLYEKPVSERYLNTDSLETVVQQLERELLSMSKEYGDYTRFMSVTWQDVQKKLDDNDVAIEFVEFSVINSDSVMYAAMAIRKGWEQPRMIPLFEKKEIEQFLQQSPDRQYSGFVGKQLCGLMWKPLEAVVAPEENVYFSAAGVYHQLALEYLPVEDGTPLCDIYQLHRLSSTRQLALTKEPESYKDAVLYGGIQYDVNQTEMLSESQKYRPDENLYVHRGTSLDSLRGSRWVALANTLPEVSFISEELKRNHIQAHTYTGTSANEESLKALSGKRINILHLATHGFFLPVEETRKINYFRLMGQEDNPLPDFSMRRSGLIMAGGNGVWTGNTIPEGVDDGILTAQEISVLDFRGMDLVVLSACETALGDISTSEGVFGLQRAFKKAGVNTLVMSLWKVNDEITRALMNKFYQALLEGKSKREAFQEAQRFIRSSHPQPRDWAAFVMLD